MRRLWVLAGILAFPSTTGAELVPVATADELAQAINAAEAGDEIVLASGRYEVGANLRCNAVGTAAAPIVVRAEKLGDATVEFNAVEGFVVGGAFWRFENLEVRGVCGADSDCEHAFHVQGDADDTTIRNNRVINFNAHVKSNGAGDPRAWPDRGLIDGNEFYNESVRQTANPVTPLDLVGGDDWVVRRNFIHDFAKGEGNGISYAAFLKGKSRRGLFERNLVACEHLHQGQIRLGLSFGGGGTGDDFCEGGTCTPEHIDGVMQNNIIANCPADVGIYVNEGENVLIQYNTLYNTGGIDLRFGATMAVVANNVIDGQVRDRDGATSVQAGNVALGTVELDALFVNASLLDFGPADVSLLRDAADASYSVVDDFCGRTRGPAFDVGALEYDGELCDTSTPFRADEPTVGADMGTAADVGGGFDMGIARPDGGGNEDDVQELGPDMATGDEQPSMPMSDASAGGCGCGQTGPVTTGFWGLLVLGFLRRRRSR